MICTVESISIGILPPVSIIFLCNQSEAKRILGGGFEGEGGITDHHGQFKVFSQWLK